MLRQKRQESNAVILFKEELFFWERKVNQTDNGQLQRPCFMT
jgi:hypothetical protein